MFGYVLPVKAEMKVKEYDAYRAVYCGVCKQLGASYGLFTRFLLNYDLVLLAVLADGASGEEGCTNCEGCFANPLAKRKTLHDTAGLRLAADGLILLSYHRLRDNLADEGFFKRIGYTLALPYMKHQHKKAAARQPELDALLSGQMQRQAALEAAGCADVDEACDPTAQMCAALFEQAAQGETQRGILHRLGLFAGQIVYLLDAAEDYENDAKRGRYNVFVNAGLTYQQVVQAAQTRCRMAAGEIARCYNLLSLKHSKPILDNIFFLGLPAGIAAAGRKTKRRPPKHGQVESV